jgi:N-acetylneuraminic acid mutarotase
VRDVLLTFDLKKEDLAGLVKASSILKATDLIIDQNSMSVTNRKGNDNTYKIDIEAAEGDTDRSFALKVEYLKLIPNDYRVQVNERVLNFTNEEKQLSYTFTLDRD